MAESDENRPTEGPLSTEEVDRLSENFRPSWELEPDPPTIPKLDPPAPPVPSPPPSPAPSPVAAPSPLAKQTLLGLAAQNSDAPPGATPGKAPDDLDWELPTNPVPSPLEESATVDAVPESKPSGIGRTYVPKDTNAPAVVLTDDVKRAEALAQAALEAEHRSRRAPTVLKIKAVEIPKAASVPDDDELPFVQRKRKPVVWILGASALAVVVIGLLALLRGGSSESIPDVAAPAPEPPKAQGAEPAHADAPPAPPEVAPSPQKSAAAAPVVAPMPDPPTPSATVAPQPAATVKPRPPRARIVRPKVTASPVSRPPPAPRPAPAPKTSPAQKSGSGVIVRDTPF